jgi:hypothetical protein
MSRADGHSRDGMDLMWELGCRQPTHPFPLPGRGDHAYLPRLAHGQAPGTAFQRVERAVVLPLVVYPKLLHTLWSGTRRPTSV